MTVCNFAPLPFYVTVSFIPIVILVFYFSAKTQKISIAEK